MARSRAESARGGSQEPHCDSRTQSARIFLPMTAERGPACKSYSASVQPQGGMPFERTQPAPRPFARRLLGARLAERHVATVQVDPASRACSMEPTRLRAAITTAAQVYDVSTQRDEPVEVQQRRMEIVLQPWSTRALTGPTSPIMVSTSFKLNLQGLVF